MQYTVTETDEDGFTVEKTGDTGTIDEKGCEADFINTRIRNNVSVAVKKAWDDDNNRDGKRPLKVTVDLLADDTVIRTTDLTQENHWMAVEKDLPETDADGKKITYTWAERDPGSGYTLSGSVKNGTVTVLTNSRDPETTEIRIEQKWVDSDDAAGLRPDKVHAQLYADGEACGDPVVLDEGNGWKHTWTEPANNGRTETVYTVEVLDVPPPYESEMSGNAKDGFVNTSTLECGSLVIRKTFDIEETGSPEEPETELRDITVRKVWEDNDDQDGIRPESVTVHLYAGGEMIRTARLNETTGWKYTFKDLPKTAHGSKIRYSVKEDPVPGYTCEVNGTTIRNIHRPDEVTVTVRKVWDDDKNAAGIRPASISVRLSNGMTVILSDSNNWQASVSGLPKRADGEEIRYSWTEQETAGYLQKSMTVQGNVTIFTNAPTSLPDIPEGVKKPSLPGEKFDYHEDYPTPLGVETIINHVGDCFD